MLSLLTETNSLGLITSAGYDSAIWCLHLITVDCDPHYHFFNQNLLSTLWNPYIVFALLFWEKNRSYLGFLNTRVIIMLRCMMHVVQLYSLEDFNHDNNLYVSTSRYISTNILDRSIGEGSGFLHIIRGSVLLFQMNLTLGITVLFCVGMKLAASTVGSFRTPGLCDPFSTFDDTFLLSTSSMKTRGMCERECLHNTRCL